MPDRKFSEEIVFSLRLGAKLHERGLGPRSEQEQTLRLAAAMSANDPKRTFVDRKGHLRFGDHTVLRLEMDKSVYCVFGDPAGAI